MANNNDSSRSRSREEQKSPKKSHRKASISSLREQKAIKTSSKSDMKKASTTGTISKSLSSDDNEEKSNDSTLKTPTELLITMLKEFKAEKAKNIIEVGSPKIKRLTTFKM